MQEIIDILERRIGAAVAMIGALREKTAALEEELVAAHAGKGAGTSASAPPDRTASEELERLRAERVMVRERVRALIREIDRVSW